MVRGAARPGRPSAQPPARDGSLVVALSELAARVQRGRTPDAILETAGAGTLQLGMRLAALQIVGSDVVVRYVATSPARLAAIEERIGRSLRGLTVRLSGLPQVENVIRARRAVYVEDLNLFERLLRLGAGFDPKPLDAAPETAGITNAVLAPLWVREKPWCLLAVASSDLTPRDAAGVTLFATQVASSLELAEYVEALEDTNRALAAVNTDLARTQEELAKRERLAALGELAAIVAHEVRNPIGVLFNSISSLRRLLPDAVIQARRANVDVLLSIVTEEAERLERIVSDLLDSAKPGVPVIQKGSVRDIIEDVVSAAQSQPRRGQVRVNVEVAHDLPDVPMDARYVRQALFNLLVNGFQALPESGCLTVRAQVEHRKERAFARVDVADTGPGIPNELKERIFEPFFTTKAAGTGLGLAIVKRIMVAHGGDVIVDSGPTGSTFSLLLPVEAESLSIMTAFGQEP